jgi:acetyltransferase (GNAT) family protein
MPRSRNQAAHVVEYQGKIYKTLYRAAGWKHIARRDGSDLGFIAVDTNPGVDYLVLYELLAPAWLRGTGLGASLLGKVEKFALGEGYERITLFPSPLE